MLFGLISIVGNGFGSERGKAGVGTRDSRNATPVAETMLLPQLQQ
jgi:hypothetical protein